MKKLLILLGVLILIVGMSGLVYAINSCVLNIPVSSTTYNGTVEMQLTVTIDQPKGNISNCTLSTTADSDFAINKTLTDGKANYSVWYFTDVNTATAITEVKQTTVTANCFNFLSPTTANMTCTATLVDFDSTAPSVSGDTDCLKPKPIIEAMDSIKFDCSRATDTTDINYSFHLQDSDGEVTIQTDGINDDGITLFNGQYTKKYGDYYLTAIICDEANTKTVSTNYTVRVTSEEDDPSGTGIIPQEIGGIQTWLIGVIVLVLVLVVIIIIVAIQQSKQPKKPKKGK